MLGFFGDLHLREKGPFLPFHRIASNGLTMELLNILTASDFICKMIESQELSTLIFLGDGYDDLNLISKRTVYVSGIFFSRVYETARKHNCKLIFIPGNHDASVEGDGTVINYLTPLSGFGLVPETHMYFEDSGTVLSILPFTKNEERIHSWLETGKTADILVSHLEFGGFTMDNGYPTSPLLNPIHRTPIVSGHLHKRQLNDIARIYYPGSIIQNKFQQRDLNSIGGMLIYNPKDKTFNLHPNDMSKHFVKVDDLKLLDTLDPERCVLSVFLECEYNDVSNHLKPFEHMFHKKRILKDNVKKTVVASGYSDPKTIFLDHMMKRGMSHYELSLEIIDDNN